MKHTASRPVRGVEMFAEISAFILLGWLCTFLFPVVYVWLQSGHLPVFGGDADISGRSVLLNIIFGINLLFLFAGLPAVAALILILIHLVVNRYAFKEVKSYYIYQLHYPWFYFLFSGIH
jgi:hypothetical protein